VKQDKEDGDDVRQQHGEHKRMTGSNSDSIQECTSNSNSEDNPAPPNLGRRIAVIGQQQRNMDDEDFSSPAQDSDNERDIPLPQPKHHRLCSLPTGRTAAGATRRRANSKYAGTRLEQVPSPLSP
jgi:hypothetical protein